ncbi:MAG: hypothetical protein ACP5IO_02955 [Elusimicrobiales bacterium]
MVVLIFFFLFFPNVVLSQVVLIDLSGTAYYRENSLSEWKKISELPLTLPSGSAIKLDEKSSAFLNVNKNSEIMLYEESAIEVEAVSEYYVSLGLVYGKGRFDVEFPKGSLFVLKTVSSSFASRKMLSFISSDLSGRSEIAVAIGECVFDYLLPHKSGERRFVISQGMRFAVENPQRPYSKKLIDEKTEKELLSFSYKSSTTWFDKIKRLSVFSSYSRLMTQRYSDDAIREKASDFESGKTLKDIHGNTVRVEQRILRPTPHQIQFVNITKRPYYINYTYSTPFSQQIPSSRYLGGAISNRIDVFAVSFEFQKPLPSRIENLPSFFADPSVNPLWMISVAANITSASSFFVAEAYKYISSRAELINNTESVGVEQSTNERDREVIITGKIPKSSLSDIINYNFVEKNPSAPTGDLVRKSDGGDITGALWGLRTDGGYYFDGDIYRIRADKYIKGANSSQPFWLISESYLISPQGSLRKKKDIETGFDSISDMVRKNFFEGIINLRQDLSGKPSEVGYNSISDNIDVVVSGQSIYSSSEYIYEAIKRWKD